MEFVNLTPHTINIKTPDSTITIPPSGKVARVNMLEKENMPIQIQGNSIPVISRSPVGIDNLPKPKDGTIYLVSSIVLDNLQENRNDVFAPDTGITAIRNEKGQITAVKRLVCKGA